METTQRVTSGATPDQKFMISIAVAILLISLWLFYTSRSGIPTLTENMTRWRMPRFANGRIEFFTAKDTLLVMQLASKPDMTWDVFSKATTALNLHPYTFVRLQDYAKKGQLSQVIAAELISADHTLKR
jgi:hypothetical protein